MARNALRILIGARVRCVRNMAARVNREAAFKIAVVALLGGGLWAGLFVLFLEGFRFLREHAFFFREALELHIFSLFFLTLFLMLVFSNALISFSNLFRSDETAFLFALPVRHDTVYLYKLLESLVFSSWAFAALGLPLLLAYGLQARAPWYFYPAMLAYLGPFVALPAALGALLGLVLTAVLPRHRAKLLMLLGCCVLAVGLYVGIQLFNVRAAWSGSWQLALQADVNVILHRLAFTQHPLAPSFWMAKGLLGIGAGNPEGLRAGALFFGGLGASALFFLALGWVVAGGYYAWTYSVAAASAARQRAPSGLLDRLAQAFRRRAPALTVLVLKDVKTFLRDPVQWSQVLIFFGLLAVYIANLRNFSYPLEEAFYKNLIAFLNLGATSMTLATLVSRFVFPLMSLEGPRFWVLGLAPIPRRQILMAKFVFSLGGALLITELLILLSNSILDTGGWVLSAQAITAAFICLGLTGLAVGLGALFPSPKEKNPSKIVSGFGGTLTLILSVTMVLLVVGVEAVVCHYYLVHLRVHHSGAGVWQFRLALLGSLGFAATVTCLAAYIPLRLGVRALERMEF